jgi:hypothetical protein
VFRPPPSVGAVKMLNGEPIFAVVSKTIDGVVLSLS